MSAIGSSSGMSMKPGATAFTWMPSGTSPTDFVNRTITPFAAAVASAVRGAHEAYGGPLAIDPDRAGSMCWAETSGCIEKVPYR